MRIGRKTNMPGSIYSLPPRQDALPIRIDVFAHFGFVIAFAIGAFLIAFAAAGKLIVIKFHAEAGFVGNADAAIDDWNAAAEYDFVLGGLPGVMGVAGVSEMRRRSGNVGHCHERYAEVRV